jgi:peptidoglycan/xylan/chitin deacetylase (PgdA/CDA1 family)
MDLEGLRDRRDGRRRELRRRRLAVTLLATTAVLVAAVVVLAGGSHSSPPQTRSPVLGAKAKSHSHHAGSAGNAARTASPAGPPGGEPVPILMYHVIAAPPPGAPFPGLYVSPREFAAQMQALKGAGWHAATLDEVASHWRTGARWDAGKPIVLTFDNGYQSQYTQALPVLKRLGWVADENIQLSGLPPSQGGLGPEQIRGMLAAGWELDTQGFSHADLIKLTPERLHYEVAVARSVLQRRYHIPVNWFCYPSGHYDATVLAAVRAAGYSGSTTVVAGWAHPGDDPLRLHRLRVLGGTTPRGLLALLAGARAAAPAPASYGGA